MGPKVPPLALPPEGSYQESPRIGDQLTARTLFQLVKERPEWEVLLNEREHFNKGDILDYKFQVYLSEVVPIMNECQVTFHKAVSILGERDAAAREAGAEGSTGTTAEVRGGRDTDVVRATREAAKALIELEPQEEATPKLPPVSSGSAAREPQPEPQSEPVEFVMYEEQLGQPKAVAIQTEPPRPSSQHLMVPREEAPSALKEPLLGNPTPSAPSKRSKTRDRSRKKEMKELPLQYQDCTCSRILCSAAMRFIFFCMMAVGLVGFTANADRVLAFLGVENPKEEGVPRSDMHRPPVVPEHEVKRPKHAQPAKHRPQKPEPHRTEPTAAPHEQPTGSHQGSVQRRPPTEVQYARTQLEQELKTLEKLEEEEAQTARVGELARLSQKENEKAAKTENKDMHLRQAALDAEVQAKVAQDELKEDSAIQKQKKRVKDAQAWVDQLERANRDKSFLGS